MRRALLATALMLAASAASAQTPGIPLPPGPPGGGPTLRCTDLALAGWNGSRSPPGAPLADNEVAIYFNVRNNGPFTYRTPDENKQWLTLVLTTARGDVDLGVSVLPTSGSGPFSLAPGANWRGHLRGTLPGGVTRAAHPPARLQINYAPASAGWSRPHDCNIANNRLSVVFR